MWKALSLKSRKDWVYLGFWILVTIVFLWDRKYLIQKLGLPNFFLCSVIRVSLLIGLAWLNIKWLIPQYLTKQKYTAYFLLTLGLVILCLVLQGIFDYLMFGFLIGLRGNSSLYVSVAYNFSHTFFYLILMVALKFSIDWYEQRKLLQDMRVEKLQAEVNYLRSQVNPHFLFNALNNLYALTLKKSDLAPDVVLKLSAIMEYMLYESDEAQVPLEKEIRYLENYLELEKLRHGDEADIKMSVTGLTDSCTVPPFLLLPLVENAFKHGISRAIHDAYLHISIQIGQGIDILVVNNKMNGQQDRPSGGIGLVNLRNRLELLYPGEYDLQTDDLPDEYRASLKINRLC